MASGEGLSRAAVVLRTQGLLLLLVALIAIFWRSSPYFLTVDNFLDIGAIASILGVMAVAETLLIISGGIDISLGSNAAISAVIMAIVFQADAAVWAAVLTALCIGAGVGLLNGLITIVFRVDALVTTLGTFSILQGLAFTIAGSRTLVIDDEAFAFLGGGELWIIPVPLVIFGTVLVVGIFVERMTTLGRSIYAIGGNLEAARNSGIRVNRIRLLVFVLAGISGSVAGVLVTSQLRAAAPQIGSTYLLSVITAVILGGASLRGGRGSLLGTLIAVAILGVLQNGFALLQWSAFAQSITLGAFLIIAVMFDQRLRDHQRRSV